MTTTATQNIGSVAQIFGAVVDVRFPPGKLPAIYSAILVQDAKAGIDMTLEVAQHLGNDVARCVAMASTDGCRRGMKAVDTGAPIKVPVGDACKGRIFNLLGMAAAGGQPPLTHAWVSREVVTHPRCWPHVALVGCFRLALR